MGLGAWAGRSLLLERGVGPGGFKGQLILGLTETELSWTADPFETEIFSLKDLRYLQTRARTGPGLKKWRKAQWPIIPSSNLGKARELFGKLQQDIKECAKFWDRVELKEFRELRQAGVFFSNFPTQAQVQLKIPKSSKPENLGLVPSLLQTVFFMGCDKIVWWHE